MRALGWWDRASRLWALCVLGAFLIAGPGVSGLEVGFHLVHSVVPGHAANAHFEQAGGASHGDHCQVGLSSATRSSPARAEPRLLPIVTEMRDNSKWLAILPILQPMRQPLPRGPPSPV